MSHEVFGRRCASGLVTGHRCQSAAVCTYEWVPHYLRPRALADDSWEGHALTLTLCSQCSARFAGDDWARCQPQPQRCESSVVSGNDCGAAAMCAIKWHPPGLRGARPEGLPHWYSWSAPIRLHVCADCARCICEFEGQWAEQVST